MREYSWSWHNDDPWLLESGIIQGEPWDEKAEVLLDFIHVLIDSQYNDIVYTNSLSVYGVLKFADIWNRARGHPFTHGDLYGMSKIAWRTWAKSAEQKREDFREGLAKRWNE